MHPFEGVNATGGEPADHRRQIVFRSFEISANLRLGTSPGGGLEIQGEIRHRHDGLLGRVPALLLRGQSVVDHAVSDAGGAFKLRAPDWRPVEIWLVVATDDVMRLELDPLKGSEAP